MSDRPFNFRISQPDGIPSQFDNHISQSVSASAWSTVKNTRPPNVFQRARLCPRTGK